MRAIETATEFAQTPLHRLEHMLHGWVNYLIMPVFALANAGIHFDTDSDDALLNSVSIGVILGLVLGKQIGITLFAWLSTKFGLATLPTTMTWRHVYGLSWIAGIGFIVASP